MEEKPKGKFSWGYAICFVAIAVLLFLVIGISFIEDKVSTENRNLQQQIQKLEVENEVLKHNYDMLSGIDNNEPSQEFELLNTIGQAIQNSKSVDLNIETENGTVRFKYDAK